MKSLVFTFIAIMLASSSGLAFEGAIETSTESTATEQKSIDFSRVNQVLKKITNAALVEFNTGYQDPALQSVELKFDEEFTDLDLYRVGAEVSATLKRSLWSKKPTTGFLRAQAEIKTPQNKAPELVVGGELGVKTETVALLRHAAKIWSAEGTCNTVVVEDFEDLLEDRLCKAVLKVTQATDYQGVVKIATDTYKSLVQFVDQALKNAQTQKEKDEAIQLEKSLAGVKFVNQNGAMELSIKEYDVKYFYIQELKVKLSSSRLSVSLSIKGPSNATAIFMGFKQDLELHLKKLENEDISVVAIVKGLALDFAEFAQEVILGKKK